MEIERKFLINELPIDLESYPHSRLEQGYLNTDPVVRVRKEDDSYYLTYKSKGFLAREEYNLPLNKEAYLHLREKSDGNLISKTRYRIPLGGTGSVCSPNETASCPSFTIELDVFDPPFAPLLLAEVEFSSIKEAESFVPPVWFGKEVTNDSAYHNSTMSQRDFSQKTPSAFQKG